VLCRNIVSKPRKSFSAKDHPPTPRPHTPPPPRSLPLPQDVIAPAKTATLNRNGTMASSAFRPWAPQNEAEDEVDLMPCTLCHKWSRVHSADNDHSGLYGLFRCGACTAVKGVGPAVRVEGQLGGFVGNVLTSRHHRNGTLCGLHTVTTTCNDTTLPPPPARVRARTRHAHRADARTTRAALGTRCMYVQGALLR
jgi:hypothetical protein